MVAARLAGNNAGTVARLLGYNEFQIYWKTPTIAVFGDDELTMTIGEYAVKDGACTFTCREKEFKVLNIKNKVTEIYQL